MRKLLFLILLVIISSGCTTAYVFRTGEVTNPTRKIVRRDKEFNKDFDNIWQAVVKACEETGASIKVIDRERGIITAEKSIAITEELMKAFETGQIVVTYDKKKPAGWIDCTATRSYVAARGKTVESSVVELDLLSELERRDAFVTFSYNVYVGKLESNGTNVIVNLYTYPAQSKIRFSTEQIEIMSGQLMPQLFEVDISQAKFISKGAFEDDFFKLIEKLIEKT